MSINKLYSIKRTDKETLAKWLKLMLVGRAVDNRAPNYLKQAIGWSYHAPFAGHDGIQLAIGQIFDREHDHLFPYYRDMLTTHSAGLSAEELILNGISRDTDVAGGGRHMSNHFAKPEWNIHNVSSCTGNQTLHAVGLARAMKKYKVTLTDSEVEHLEEITRKGKRRAQVIRNAYVLLNCNEADNGKKQKDEDVSKLLGITVRTLENIRKKFVLEGFDIALYGKKSDRVYNPKVDGDVEAHLVALSCSDPPKGYSRWSLRLLSSQMVELQYVDSISHEAVRTVLKKRIKAVAGERMANITTKQ